MMMKMNKVSPRQVLIALAIATVIYLMFSNNKKSMYSVEETMYAPSGYGADVGPSEPGTACEMKAGTGLASRGPGGPGPCDPVGSRRDRRQTPHHVARELLPAARRTIIRATNSDGSASPFVAVRSFAVRLPSRPRLPKAARRSVGGARAGICEALKGTPLRAARQRNPAKQRGHRW